MQPLDPITLAAAAVGVAVVLSALLLLLFATREEKYEDAVLAQKQEQDAFLARTVSTKAAKQRKKPPRGKKKPAEHDADGIPSSNSGEEVDEDMVTAVVNTAVLEEEPVKPILKEHSDGKKKPKKKNTNHEPSHSTAERHAHFSAEGGDKPREEEEVVVEQIPVVSEELMVESVPDLPEEILPVKESVSLDKSTPPSAKKTKAKPKPAIPKDKPLKPGDVCNKLLRQMVTVANLNSGELQDLIDILLNKQGESTKWQKSTAKADPLEVLKKQLQEKDAQIKEEHQKVQNAAARMKELREELGQEKTKLKSQQENANKKIAAQGTEIQALQNRIAATQNTHRIETQTLVHQIHQMKEQMNNSSVGNVQRLQEENSHLKSASMRATQLTADKESLTQELNKLQQSHRQLKSDLGARMDQLKQADLQRQTMESQMHQLNLDVSKRKEAENALAKRLREVNDEVKKSDARSGTVSKDLENTVQALRSEEAKSAELVNRIKSLEQRDKDVGSLSAQLQESANRVAEFQALHAQAKNQLKEAEEKHALKDKEIQVLRDELNVVQVTQVETVAAVPNHMESDDTVNRLEESLKQKEAIIAELAAKAAKADGDLASLQSQVEKQSQKNNELRTKNWKAMEALTSAEKSTQQQISKACEAVKEESDASLKKSLDQERLQTQDLLCKLHPGVTVDRSLAYNIWITQFQEKASEQMKSATTNGTSEKDEQIAKLTADVNSNKEEVKKMEQIIDQQKQKNNDLREKNWKAMDALNEAEKNTNNQVKKAVQSAKEDKDKSSEQERATTKEILSKIHPDVSISPSLPFGQWLVEFEKNASQPTSNDEQQVDDLMNQLEEAQETNRSLVAECDHYKGCLEDTESMLRKLEENVEAEMASYGEQLDQAQVELKKSSERIESLERDLAKASTATESQADNFSALEEKLQRASAAEEEAKNKIASLERELSSAKASSSQESLRLAEIQKELTRENQQVKELNEKLARLEATKAEQAKSTKSKTDARPVPPEEEGKLRRELSATKKQLEDAVMRMSDLEHQLKAAQDELKRALANEDRISRASADLEESIEAVNGSPEKKKKGLKGAFGKLKKKDKDKESKNAEKDKMVAQLDEAQRQISASRSEIEELRTAKASLEKQNAELKRLSVGAGDSMTKSQQIEKDIGEAMADGLSSGSQV